MFRHIITPLAAALLTASAALAVDPALIERSETQRVANFHFTGVTEAQLKTRMRDTRSRIIDLEIVDTSPMRFNAVTVRGGGPHSGAWWWSYNMTQAQVNAMVRDKKARITDLEVYRTSAGLRFAVVLKQNTGAHARRWKWTFAKTVDQIKQIYRDEGMKLVDIERYRVGGQTRFAAVMTDNRGAAKGDWAWYVGRTSAQVDALQAERRMRVIDMERHSTSNGPRYDIILRPYDHGTQYSWQYFGLSKSHLPVMLRRHSARVIDSESVSGDSVDVVLLDNGINKTGDCTGRLAHFGNRLSNLMKLNAVPGAQIAVVKANRLVYSCALGVASLESGTHVEPDHLFRIMSISKLLTRSAVHRYDGQGRFTLATTMLAALGDRAPDAPYASGWMRRVTVGHLMSHTSGLWRDTPYDPMVRQDQTSADAGIAAPMSCRQVMTHTIKTFPLNFRPGTRQTTSDAISRAYSNVGYCILQQILAENATGSYQQIVKREILEPAGVTAMRIGRGRLQERAPKEVRYYHTPLAARVTSQYPSDDGTVTLPYSYVVEAMAGHGGWIASANDLVRYAAFTPVRPDGTSSIRHGGWLPGSRTVLRQVGDVHVAILTNGSPTDFDGFDLSKLVDDAVSDTGTWPNRNLWEKYGYPAN